MSNQPLLSIGMIVKNEMRCLEKCLKALQPLRDAIPCELVIADTGSTDGTREVAEKYADILFDFAWVNDFSAARNAVIGHCSGKWYMTVDADEYLVPEISELVEFLTGPKSERMSYATYIQRNHVCADMQGTYCDFNAVRMARMVPGLRYTGTIHEMFEIKDINTTECLANTIFDHDGYAEVTPEYRRKKGERNLELLEKQLEKDPENCRCILECMEAAALAEKKLVQYVYRGMKLIQEKKLTGGQSERYEAAIAREAVICAVNEDLPEVEEWVAWTRKTFPDFYYTRIDISCIYAFYLDRKGRSEEAWQAAQEYFRGLKSYERLGGRSVESVTSPLRCCNTGYDFYCMAARSCLKIGKKQQALDMLGSIDLCALNANQVDNCIGQFEEMAVFPAARKAIEKKLLELYEKCKSGSDQAKTVWEIVYAHGKESLAINRENAAEISQLYINFPGTIGHCARLVNAVTVEEGQARLDPIEDWNELMPLALVRAMELDLVLPDAFYRIAPERLHEIEIDLAQYGKDAVRYALHYSDPAQITDWHHLYFAFDMLCAVCMQNGSFESEYADALGDRFAQIGAQFLQEYYNPNVIANEDAIDRLPALHRFVWHYVKAAQQRLTGDEAGYIRSLRDALKETEVLKDFVGYLLHDVKERHKRENERRIAAASPELLALAEQVRKILANYPADDPAVVQLKQTPVYQQVAFLIEA